MLQPPDFTDEKWSKSNGGDDELVKVITNGKVEMPPFGKKLTRQQIAELVTYIHRFPKPTEQKSN